MKGIIQSGILKAWKMEGRVIYLQYEQARVQVSRSHADGICIQLHTSDSDTAHPGYAIINRQELAWSSVKETEHELILDTGTFYLKISKKQFRTESFTSQHTTIIADHETLGYMWKNAQIWMCKEKRDAEKIIGLGEKTGPLDKSGKVYTHWNHDHFAYGQDSDPLYASFPFYYGIHGNTPYGIFVDQSHKSVFDFGTSNEEATIIKVQSHFLSYHLFYTGDIRGVLKAYTDLTGYAPMPPVWSLGYQQCRYSYYPQDEVISVAETFRRKEIPIDVIYLDIHYMDRFKVFSWNPDFFSGWKQMIDKLHELGIRLVIILDPGIRVDETYDVYNELIELGAYVKWPDGKPYIGNVWPGRCIFPDFSNPTAREWWQGRVKSLREAGVDGFWNDMNEPAVFGNAFPDITLFDMEGKGGDLNETKNIYGMQMSRSTYDGASAGSAERAFILTRAAFSGSQQYTAIWTGDNVANGEHVKLSSRLCANLGLAGMPISGADVGGFVGDTYPELYKRWIALGAFLPLFRTHTMINSMRAEPWSFGEEVEEISKAYIGLRSRMSLYWYSLLREYQKTGIPPLRSIALEHWADEQIYRSEFSDQFFLGSHMMIVPVQPHATVIKIYFPAGKWFDWYTDKIYEGSRAYLFELHPHWIPVFIREGALIPLKKEVTQQFNLETEEIEWHLYGTELPAEASLYLDDGISHDWKDGKYYERRVKYDPKERKLSFYEPDGKYFCTFLKINICIHGDENVQNAGIQADKEGAELTNYRLVNPVSNFDPFPSDDLDTQIIFGLKIILLTHSNEKMEVRF